jgi:hypothetical protein
MGWKVEKRRSDPDLEAIFATAWRAARQVAVAEWRGAATVSVLPAVAASLVWGLPENALHPGGTGLLYVGTVLFTLAWYLRACLMALYPDAAGGRIALVHHVWRVGLAWGVTVLPAILAFPLLGTWADPASGWFVALVLAAIPLTVTAFALAAATSARVAATGRVSPGRVWRLLRGRRLVSVFALFLVLAMAGGFGGFLYLPSFALEALGVPWAIAILPGGVLAHGAVLLGLAAVSTGVHDVAARAAVALEARNATETPPGTAE